MRFLVHSRPVKAMTLEQWKHFPQRIWTRLPDRSSASPKLVQVPCVASESSSAKEHPATEQRSYPSNAAPSRSCVNAAKSPATAEKRSRGISPIHRILKGQRAQIKQMGPENYLANQTAGVASQLPEDPPRRKCAGSVLQRLVRLAERCEDTCKSVVAWTVGSSIYETCIHFTR
jgi:hypothetical protein